MEHRTSKREATVIQYPSSSPGAKILWRELNKYYGCGKVLLSRKYAIEIIKSRHEEYVNILKYFNELLSSGHPISKYCTLEELAQDENGFVYEKILKDIIS